MEIYNVQDFKALKLNAGKIYYKQKGKTKIGYYEDFGTFDTEFTTIQRENPDKIDAFGLLYLWQACICGYVVMGRTMPEFVDLVKHLTKILNLSEKRKIVFYVHNLECDFMYLQGYFSDWRVFATAKRAVLTATTGGVEFRCSYKLTNMSLKKFLESEGVKTQKQSGEDFDYKKLRTPKTPLLPHEVYYAYCDVKGLYEAIGSLMQKTGDNIATIPLTSTGYVRRDCRNAMAKNPKNRESFKNMALNADEYSMFRDAFRGGNTHANRYWAGEIQKDLQSFDIASSYPSVMLYEKYPYGMCSRCDARTLQDLDDLTDSGYGYICKIEFTNLRTNAYIPYVPIAKVQLDGLAVVTGGYVVNDNGRLLFAAGKTTMTILDIDLRIIRDTYMWDDVQVTKCYFYRMEPLPLELRETISEYFEKKTTLKGVEGQEYFYMKSKNKLNSCYGMTVSAPVHFNITLKEGQWTEEIPSDLIGFYEDGLEHFYKSRNNFLAYQWGVYVTAYARARLQEAIDICGPYIVYCDTDSVKFLRKPEIADRIKEINARIKAKAEQSETTAKAYTKDGEEQILGLWDEETPYIEFITYGAKKYADVKLKKGKEVFEITVSGLSKKAADEIGDIDHFKPGLIVHNSGRTISVYDDNMEPHFVEIDGETFEIRGNMAIVDTTYKLGVTDLYDAIINRSKNIHKRELYHLPIFAKKIRAEIFCSTWNNFRPRAKKNQPP